MKELFKEVCNEKTTYMENIDKMIYAIQNNKLKELLFDEIELTVKKHNPNRSKCAGCPDHRTNGKDAEKRICRCLFYKNMDGVEKDCNSCVLEQLYNVKKGRYTITNYEIPAYYSGKGIGEIDLIISDEEFEYATEVKPHTKEDKKDNPETLLRMIAEILTYIYGFEEGKYKKAIAFFENTPQYNEYQEQNPKIMELLKLADISVFLFKETKENHVEYEIIKM